MRRVTAATVSTVAVASMLTVVAGAHRAVATPRDAGGRVPSVTFNMPSGSPEEQNAIGTHVTALAAGVPRGGLIRIAIYRFTSPTFAQSLLDDWKRGVRVQLVVDAGARRSRAYRRLAAALGTSRRRSSWVTACKKGCIAGHGRMHNKFYLFSSTGRARHVVVQSSANLTTTNRVNAWNNAVTFSDARLYRAYGRYFSAMAARRRYGYHVTRSDGRTLYTFPRAGRTKKSDTLYELLGHVGCAAHTAVHVTAFSLTRPDIARRLWSLAHQGCDVRVVYTNLGRGARKILTRSGGPRLLSSHYSYLDLEAGGAVEAYAHSKYVTIGGTYSGRDRRLVITGSANYTGPGLRENDETMLEIRSAAVYGAYEANFADLWHTAAIRFPLGGHVIEK